MLTIARLISSTTIMCVLNLVTAGSTPYAHNEYVAGHALSFSARQEGVFDFGLIHFRNDFPGARLNKISQINDSTFRLLIEPENTPINKSSWYAFKIWSDKEVRISISLEYSFGEHRYAPKVSNDGNRWKSLEGNSEIAMRKTDAAVYRVAVSPDTIWFAAQEILNSQYVWNWVDSLAATSAEIEKEIIGKSIEGRPIVALRIGSSEPKPVLVVLSRQHPPEVTGQLAMKAFVEELIGRSESSKQFLNSFSVILVPLMNPDGVEHGHWRNNMNGVDLNRDWSEFQQPETRSVKQYLEKQVALGDSIVFALDFHSTKTDVFYVVTDLETSLTNRWISSLHNALPEAAVNKSFHGLESATSKNWIYKRFGAEAVTYEVGDETDRVILKHLGKMAAICLQKELMNSYTAAKR